jgi:hypothetical protein
MPVVAKRRSRDSGDAGYQMTDDGYRVSSLEVRFCLNRPRPRTRPRPRRRRRCTSFDFEDEDNLNKIRITQG